MHSIQLESLNSSANLSSHKLKLKYNMHIDQNIRFKNVPKNYIMFKNNTNLKENKFYRKQSNNILNKGLTNLQSRKSYNSTNPITTIIQNNPNWNKENLDSDFLFFLTSINPIKDFQDVQLSNNNSANYDDIHIRKYAANDYNLDYEEEDEEDIHSDLKNFDSNPDAAYDLENNLSETDKIEYENNLKNYIPKWQIQSSNLPQVKTSDSYSHTLSGISLFVMCTTALFVLFLFVAAFIIYKNREKVLLRCQSRYRCYHIQNEEIESKEVNTLLSQAIE